MKIDKWKLMASVCRESFYEFVVRFWDVINVQKPVWNWHIKFLCDEMQKAAERVFLGLPKLHDYIINVPPGTSKSTICSIMFPAWVLARMPSAHSLCASHTEDLVYDLSNKSRMIVQSEKYQACFPEITLREDQNTKGYWMTEQGGWRKSCTVGGKNPMGFHAHFIIVDDPIDPQAIFSEPELITANRFMTDTLPSRTVDAQVTVTFVIMQRLHQNDPTGARLGNPAMGKVRHICLPAELTGDVKPSYLRKRYIDNLLDPIRFPRVVLDTKRPNAFVYAGQYLQTPIPEGGGDIDTTRLNFGRMPAKFKKIWRYWDKAGTKNGGARTAGVKMGEDFDGRIWIINVVKGQWASYEREKTIKQTAILDTKLVSIGVEQEPGSGGKESAENTARNLKGYKVKLDKPTGDKRIRAQPFGYYVGCGLVWLPIEEEWTREYIDELRNFPLGTFKDQVDASSGAFNLLVTPKVRFGAALR